LIYDSWCSVKIHEEILRKHGPKDANQGTAS